MKKLNLACGRDIQKGYINSDLYDFDGVDIKFDFNKFPYPFKDNELDEIRAMRILEYSNSINEVMEEFYRICKNGAKIIINVPASPSPHSFQNPLIKAHFTYNTFTYYERNGGVDQQSFNPHFKIIKRKYIFSSGGFLSKLNFLPNLFPKFYTRFLFMIFPSDRLYFELDVKK